MIKRCARQIESLHESSALAHDCPSTIALGNVEVGLKAAEPGLVTHGTANVNCLGLDFSTCAFAFPPECNASTVTLLKSHNTSKKP